MTLLPRVSSATSARSAAMDRSCPTSGLQRDGARADGPAQQRGGRVDQRGRLALLAWLGAYGAGQQPRQNYGAQHEDRHPDDNQRGIVLVHTTDKRNSGERNALPGQQPNDGR